jgi:hypothetical protein
MNTEAKTFYQILEENFQKSEFNIYRYLTRIAENYETANYDTLLHVTKI